ncbi:MAG: ParB N-terminal domain-containing protein [Amphiplicatus sp.]|nr:ParB N-terminal domain-containing protein [Amphiplicatus sp.]MCB9956151.1 ParB N-terminal domain-containing protein [Caulobacterales bacterium]
MHNPARDEEAVVVNLQERRLDRTILRTYRTRADLDDVVPNENQPRLGPKLDDELQRQIEANGGLFEPLLVEPHPQFPGKFRIIDGDRRWTNSKALVDQGKDEYRKIPIEVTDRTLSEEDRFRVWIYIHRQRKEWDAKEKEMVAYRLVDLMGRTSAANILGVTVREIDKLVDVFELSEKFKGLRDPSAAITWARELMGVSKKLLTPSVVEAVVKKVNQKRISNSKDLRKLRTILPDPVARAHFMSDEGDIDSALLRIATAPAKAKRGLPSDLEAAIEAMKKTQWAELEALRGDPEFLKRIEDAENMLKSLRKALS